MSTTKDVPPLGDLTTEQYRQHLAGLIDTRQKIATTDREVVRLTAIDFVACLPKIFGSDLDRITLWDRIGVVQRSETVYRNSGDVVECLVVLVSGDQSARGWRLIQDREAQDVDTK